jgi:hypothetical protein
MPDEKMDQKRPIEAENEPKPIQQRHVDDAVDDSFPASDPPACTTSASKSVAAECEPGDLNEAPYRPVRGSIGEPIAPPGPVSVKLPTLPTISTGAGRPTWSRAGAICRRLSVTTGRALRP